RGGQVLGGRISSEELRRHHVHALVRALRGQNGGDEQLVRVAEVERALRVRIGSVQAPQNLLNARPASRLALAPRAPARSFLRGTLLRSLPFRLRARRLFLRVGALGGSPRRVLLLSAGVLRNRLLHDWRFCGRGARYSLSCGRLRRRVLCGLLQRTGGRRAARLSGAVRRLLLPPILRHYAFLRSSVCCTSSSVRVLSTSAGSSPPFRAMTMP